MYKFPADGGGGGFLIIDEQTKNKKTHKKKRSNLPEFGPILPEFLLSKQKRVNMFTL